MGYVISITNQKGGVAKTTTAIHLAAGLAKKKITVLLIDLDPQRNATSVILKKADWEPENTIFSAFQSKSLQGSAIHSTSYESLHFIPSSLRLVEVENMLSGSPDGFFRLSDSLGAAVKEFDYIILDCPPSLSMLTINALVVATHAIIPLQVSKFSIDGITGLLDVIATVQKRYNAKLKVLGGLFSLYDERTTMAKMMDETMSGKIPVFKTKIPRSVAVEESHMLKSILFDYAPNNKVSKAYQKLTMEVIHGLK